MVARSEEMPSDSEEVLNGGVDAEESLGLASRFEPSHLAFSLPCGLMRDFSPVVLVLPRRVENRCHQFPMSGTVASQFVGDEPVGSRPLTFQELAKESPSRLPIPTLLQEDVDCVSILVNRPPEIEALSPDGDEELVQVPDVAQLAFPVSQPARIGGSELEAPVSDRLVRHDDPPFRQEVLNVSETEGESVVRIPGDVDHPFRTKLTTDSGGS